MKNKVQIPDQTDSPGRVKEAPPRATFLIAGAVIVALVCVILVAAYRPFRAASPSPIAKKSEPKRLTHSRVEPAAPSDAVSGKRSATAGSASVQPAPGTASWPLRSAPTPYMRELVSDLSRFDLKQGVSPEQAAKWKKNLKKVIEQGDAAVPAIAEFLERNVDLDFTKVPGGDAMGYPSLRQALIDSLKQIGGPVAVETMVATLRTTAVPSEIVALARALEQQAPDQLRVALEAAREALAMADQGQLAKVDVGPLFQLFQKYGGQEVVGELEKASSKWHYYATMALADLPEGVGIPALMQLAQDPNAMASGSSSVATRLLAQMTLQYPDAQNGLALQARNGQIPDLAWQGIALALSGVRLQYGQDQFPSKTSGSSWTHYVVIGNQSFSTVPALGSFSSEQVQHQLGFIEQLLNIESLSPLAKENLLTVKTKLKGGP